MKINNNLDNGCFVGDVIVDSLDNMYLIFANKFIYDKSDFYYGFLKINGDEELSYASDFEKVEDAVEDFLDHLGSEADFIKVIPSNRLSLNLD